MKLDNITTKLIPVKTFISRYAIILFALGVVAIFAYMTLSITHYANIDPTSQQEADRNATLTPVKLDEVSITKIKQLQDQNISIESLFNNGRANPFQ